ncbi:hypothetical protein, conserved in T. vivax, partial [Trypanosoma vivax Y486]
MLNQHVRQQPSAVTLLVANGAHYCDQLFRHVGAFRLYDRGCFALVRGEPRLALEDAMALLAYTFLLPRSFCPASPSFSGASRVSAAPLNSCFSACFCTVCFRSHAYPTHFFVHHLHSSRSALRANTLCRQPKCFEVPFLSCASNDSPSRSSLECFGAGRTRSSSALRCLRGTRPSPKALYISFRTCLATPVTMSAIHTVYDCGFARSLLDCIVCRLVAWRPEVRKHKLEVDGHAELHDA